MQHISARACCCSCWASCHVTFKHGAHNVGSDAIRSPPFGNRAPLACCLRQGLGWCCAIYSSASAPPFQSAVGSMQVPSQPTCGCSLSAHVACAHICSSETALTLRQLFWTVGFGRSMMCATLRCDQRAFGDMCAHATHHPMHPSIEILLRYRMPHRRMRTIITRPCDHCAW